jgi:GNAT superfamily N-acetyltransferase
MAGAELSDPAFAVRLGEAEGEPVAYVKLGPPSLPFEPQGEPIELRQLYVLKPWQGSGAAQHLMEWAMEESRRRGADELYLSVFTDNHRARRFYERYGFRFVQTYAFMVGGQADEDHILRLDLKEAG